MALASNMSKPAPNRVRRYAFVLAALLRGAGSSSTPSYEKASGRTFRHAAHSALSDFQASQTKTEEGLTAPGVSRVFSSKVVELHGINDRFREAKRDSESTQTYFDIDAAEVVFQPDQVRAALIRRDEKDGESRRLQTCAAGSGVTITSSLVPLLEGCLAETGVYTGAEVAYASDYGLVVPGAFFEGDITEYWGALYRATTSTETYDIGCVSVEPADEVHPSTATWICLDDSGSLFVVGDSQFAVDCGCDGISSAPSPSTPSPAAGASSSAPASSSSSLGTTCADQESFAVTTVLIGADGCYVEDPLYQINDEPIYTQSGTSDDEGFWVYAFPLSDVLSSTVHWWIAYVVAAGGSSSFSSFHHCYSLEPASAVHPADVGTWYCNFESSSTDTATAGELSIDCGCSAVTDSSLTAVPETPGPTPETTLPAVLTTPMPAASILTVAPTTTAVRGIAISPSPTEASTSFPAVASTPTPNVALTSPPVVTSTTSPVVASTTPPTVAPITSSPTIGNEVATTSPILSAYSTSSPVAVIDATSCGETESVQVTSAELSEIEGCFQQVDLSASDSGLIDEAWTIGGGSDLEQVAIIAQFDDGTGDEGTTYPYIITFVSETEDLAVVYCVSAEDAVTVHPADATWICDLDGSGAFTPVTDADVSTSCGCTASSEEASTNGGGAVGRSLSSWPAMALATFLMVVAGALPRGL